MATLTPVDNDPFAPPTDAGSPKLTPVDHDPFASSTTPTTSVAPQPSSGYGILDYLHSASQGLNAATRVATDWPTLGLVDKLFGKQAQDDTAAAHKQMGAWDLPLSIVGSAVSGGPELKAASAIGEAAAPYLAKLPLTGSGKWLGGVIGSGVVGAPMSGLAEYGHEAGWTPDVSAIGKATVAGGALSAGTGMLGGVTGRGGAPAPSVAEGALRADAKTAYSPLDEYVFHGPSQIKPALDSVTNTMTQAEQDLAKQTMAKVNKLADTNLATGSDIQDYQRVFGDLSSSSVKADREYAPQFKDALETVMQGDPYGRNLTPGKGMSLQLPGSLGGTGLKTGGAAEARDAGDVFFGRANDVARLDDPDAGWISQSQVKGGPDVGNQVSSWLRTGEGQQFAPRPAPGAPPNAYTAYNTVAGTGAGEESVPWWVKHFVVAPTIGMAATEGINAATGQEQQSPMARVGEDLAVGIGLALGTMGYGALTGRVNALTQQRAIDALRSTISTGNYQAPLQAMTPLRNAIRQAIYGGGGSGRY